MVVGCASAEAYGHTLARVIGRELSVVGVRGSPHVWPQTIDLITRGKMNLTPMITRRYKLAEFEEAFAVAQKGGPDVLKVLLEA